ncbi:phosphonate monoester hydrolase [Vallitalea longa]|uniref:Phosphonate monoester hydrolase n=1 Tax=Vallitalea longa TaxID=2936439 RepID=A0A9W5YEZ8_9FIRM|nr:sulfatase-like hydrolase/transferase [Vallitalea longa]GKX31461.1 phosphonate monoester hydrolase [Vallitalea longa]
MPKNKKPNILHIFVDQMRHDTIAALGNPVIKTPNLDRLAQSGISFTNAYTPSPVCIAARCSMIYGQYPMHTGTYENRAMPQDGRETFMDGLKDNGYHTYGIGKCHFSPNSEALLGFEERERQEELTRLDLDKEPYLQLLKDKGYDYVCEPHGIRGEMYYVPQPSQLPESLHPTTWIRERTQAFLERKKDSDKPWYLFSSFIHPHPPFAPPNPWHKIYRGALMPLPNVPANVDSLQTYVNKCQNRYKYKDQGLDNNLLRTMKAYYYACISFIDYQVGLILDTLESTGQLDNTLIIFTSDHGEHLGDYNCFGKRSFHDTAARIPMLVSMPGKFEGGVTCDTPVSLIDLAPTFLNLGNANIKSHELDGEDLYDIFTGASKRDTVFGQLSYFNPRNSIVEDNDKVSPILRENEELWRASASTYMAVSKDWKYFYSAPDEQEYLFNKKTDPFETRNSAGLVFNKQNLLTMRHKTMDFLRNGNETAGVEGDQWKLFGKKIIPDDPDTGLLIQDTKMPWVKNEVKNYSEHNLDRMF